MKTAERAVESFIFHKEQRKATAGDIPAVGRVCEIGCPCFDSIVCETVVDINISIGGDGESLWLIQILREILRRQSWIRKPHDDPIEISAGDENGVVGCDKYCRQVCTSSCGVRVGGCIRISRSARARQGLIERLTYPMRGVE